MKHRSILYMLPLLLVLVLMGFLWFGLHLDPENLDSVLVDHPVPTFELTALQNKTERVTQKDLSGKIRLLNVWASWCFSCAVEHPFLVRVAQQEHIAIVGVDYKDDRASALDWLKVRDNPYEKIIFDGQGQLAIDLGVYGTPDTFLIDKKGVIRYRHIGVLDERSWQDEFLPRIRELRAE